MDEPYKNREIDHFMGEFDKRMTHQDDVLIEIKIQTLKTNGRVNRHDWYFQAMWWALGLVGAFIAYTAPAVIRFVKHIDQLDAKVTAISDDYSITTEK